MLEEAVIWSALAWLNDEAVLIADRGFRRKASLVKLLRRSVLFVIRVADNIHVLHQGEWRNILETARSHKPLGKVTWKEGTAHARPCQAVVWRARPREAPGEDDPTQPNPELGRAVFTRGERGVVVVGHPLAHPDPDTSPRDRSTLRMALGD
jgi:hypothetical protein